MRFLIIEDFHIEHLLCTGDRVTQILHLKLSIMQQVLSLFPLSQIRKWGKERLGSLRKVT